MSEREVEGWDEFPDDRQPPAEDALKLVYAWEPDLLDTEADDLAQRIEDYVQLRIDEYIEGALYAHDREPLLARHEETQSKLEELRRDSADYRAMLTEESGDDS